MLNSNASPVTFLFQSKAMFLQKLCSIMTFLYWAASHSCWYPKGGCLMAVQLYLSKVFLLNVNQRWKCGRKSIQMIYSVISRHIDIENCKMVCLLSNTRFQKSLVSMPLIWPNYNFHAPCPKYCVILAGFHVMYTVILVKMTWMGIYE